MEFDIDFTMDESLLKELSFKSPAENARSDGGDCDNHVRAFSSASLLALDSGEEIAPLEDEIFDFDISMSPESGLHKSKETRNTKPVETSKVSSKTTTPGTPLSDTQMMELFNEAQSIAVSLQEAGDNERIEKARHIKIPLGERNFYDKKSKTSMKPKETYKSLRHSVKQEKPLSLKLEGFNRINRKLCKLHSPGNKKGKDKNDDSQNDVNINSGGCLTVSADPIDSMCIEKEDVHRGKQLELDVPNVLETSNLLNAIDAEKDNEKQVSCPVKSLKRPANFSPLPDAKRHAPSGIKLLPGLASKKSGIAAASSGLKPPTNLARIKPNNLSLKVAEQTSVKAPSLKPSLLQKPATVMTGERRKPLKAGFGLKAPGPLKAMNSAITDRVSQPLPKRPKLSPTPRKGDVVPDRVAAATHDTPVKQDKHVQPKRLIEQDPCKTPERKNSSGKCSVTTPVSQSAKRRSFLPTPSKLGSASSSRPSMSSTSSMDSAMASPSLRGRMSPALRGRSPRTTPVLALVDITGINEQSPSCLKPRKQRVLRTPLNQENETKEPKRSLWSPIKRNKLSVEDQIYQCTKRTAKK